MKKNNPVFGILFAVVVAAIFLSVSFPSNNNSVAKNTTSYIHSYL